MIGQDIYEGVVGYLPSPMYYTRRGLVVRHCIAGVGVEQGWLKDRHKTRRNMCRCNMITEIGIPGRSPTRRHPASIGGTGNRESGRSWIHCGERREEIRREKGVSWWTNCAMAR